MFHLSLSCKFTMDYLVIISLLVPVFLCMISKEVFSSEIQSSDQPGKINHRKWVSTIVSEHIWDYRIISETNPECTRHFEAYRKNLNNFTTWAVQMFDASDLVPGGFLVGDNYKLGNWEECIDTQIPEELGFSTQYCLPSFKFTRKDIGKSKISDEWDGPVWGRLQTSKERNKAPKDVFNLAFCIPSTCSSLDLQHSLQNLLEGPMRDAAYDLNVTVDTLMCTTKEGPAESNGHLVVRWFFLGMTSILVLCSITDIFLTVVRGKTHDVTNRSFSKATGMEKWLIPFSIFRNLPPLIASPTSPEDYKVLHVVKAVSMVIAIMAHHKKIALEQSAIVNWSYFETYTENKIASFFQVFMPIPDIFFCISGFLLCMSMMKQLENNNFSLWRHVASKLIRFLPPYIFVMACTALIIPYLDNGPFWKAITKPEAYFCQKNWWTNILFINNYYGELGNWCLPHNWYMAVDMHCFVVSTTTVYLCWRWESQKKVILGAAFFLSFLLPFMTVYRNNYEGLLKLYHDFITRPRSHETLLEMYRKSHCRFGGCISGIAAAFLLRHLQKTGYKFSTMSSLTGVLTSVSTIVAASVARHLLHQPTEAYGVIAHALYAGLHTQLLSIAFMIIIIIQITTGFGSLDSLFPPLDSLVPLSRLSYWVFLLNIPIIQALVASCKTPMSMTYEEMAFAGQHWGGIILTYIVAGYCYLIIEAPINHFKPMILRYTPKTQLLSNKKIQ